MHTLGIQKLAVSVLSFATPAQLDIVGTISSVDVGAGILAVLAWLACCLRCSVAGALFGVGY